MNRSSNIAQAIEIAQEYVTENYCQKWLNERYIQQMEKIKQPQIKSLSEKIQILQEREKQLNQLQLSQEKVFLAENLIKKFKKSQEIVEQGIEDIKNKLREAEELNLSLQVQNTESQNEYQNKLDILNIQKEEFIPYVYQMEEYSNSINNQMLAEIIDTIDPEQQNAFKALAILIVTQVHQLQQIQQINREQYREWNEAQKIFRLNNIKNILLNFDIKLVNEEDIELVQEILRDGVLDLSNHSGFNLYNWTQVCLNYWEAYQPIKFQDLELIQLSNFRNTLKQDYQKHVRFMNQIEIQFDREEYQYNQAKEFIELNKQDFDIALIEKDNNKKIIQIQQILGNHIESLCKYQKWSFIITINEIIQFKIIPNLCYEKCVQIEKSLYKIVCEENIQLIASYQNTYPFFDSKLAMMENNQISIIFDPFQMYKLFQEYLRYSNQQICSLTLASHIINYETLQLKNLEESNYLFLMLNSINNIKQLVEYLKNTHCKPKVIIVLQNLEFEEMLKKQFNTDYINLTFSMEPEDSLINFINIFFITAKIINQESYYRLKQQQILVQSDLSNFADLQNLSKEITNIYSQLCNLHNSIKLINYSQLAQFIVNMYLTFRQQMNNIGFPDYLEKVQKLCECESINAYQCVKNCLNFTQHCSNLSQKELFEKTLTIMRKEFVFIIYEEIYDFLTFELYIQLIECFRISSEIKADFQLNFDDFFNNYQNELNQFNSEITQQLIIENDKQQINEQIQKIYFEIQHIPQYDLDLELSKKEKDSLNTGFLKVREEINQLQSELQQNTDQLEQLMYEINQIKQYKLIELDPQKCFELCQVLDRNVFEQFVQIMILHNMNTDQAQIQKFFKNKTHIQKLNQNPIINEESISKFLQFRNTCYLNQSSNALQKHLEEYIKSIVRYNENKQKQNKLINQMQALESRKDILIKDLNELEAIYKEMQASYSQKQTNLIELENLQNQRYFQKGIYQDHKLNYYDQAIQQFQQYIKNLQTYRYQLIIIKILNMIESQSNYNLLKLYLTMYPRNNQLTSPCNQIFNVNTMNLIQAFNINLIKNIDIQTLKNQNSNKIYKNIQQYYVFIDSWMRDIIDNKFGQNRYQPSEDLINLLHLGDEKVQEIERIIFSYQVHQFYSCQDPQFMVFQVLMQLLAIDQSILRIFDAQQKAYIEQILKTFLDSIDSRDLNIHLKQIFKLSAKTTDLIRMFATAIILQIHNKLSLMEYWQIIFYQDQIGKLIIPFIINKQIQRIINGNRNINEINEIIQEYDVGFQFEN